MAELLQFLQRTMGFNEDVAVDFCVKMLDLSTVAAPVVSSAFASPFLELT